MISKRRDISFYKKLSLYLDYRKVILENKKELESRFGFRVDRINRIYTVLNLPNELFGEPYNLRKADIDKISENYIKEFTTKVRSFLASKGIAELVDFYEPVSKIEKYSYLVVLGYSFMDTSSFYRNLIILLLSAIVITGVSLALQH